MLTKRIIPCLDVYNGRVVKGVQFANVKDLADPVELGSYYANEGADELVFYDIGASNTGKACKGGKDSKAARGSTASRGSKDARGINSALVEAIASHLSIPFTVGGGIRTLEDFYTVLGAGADKVSINTAAVQNPSLITEGAKRFGSQCVVVSMDIKKEADGTWRIYTHGGRVATPLEALSWAREIEFLGAGELVINAIHSDGMRTGFDLDLTRSIAECVSIPVVASGGAGKASDFYDILAHGKADAALAASVFHKKEILIPTLKQLLKEQGLPIRS